MRNIHKVVGHFTDQPKSGGDSSRTGIHDAFIKFVNIIFIHNVLLLKVVCIICFLFHVPNYLNNTIISLIKLKIIIELLRSSISSISFR